MMRKLWTAIAGSFVMLLVMMPSLALAAKKAAANVVIVADTRRLDGIMLWWAQMYNDSHLYFTILTIIIIPTVGCIFGFLADVVMSHIGIDLKHRELAERCRTSVSTSSTASWLNTRPEGRKTWIGCMF